MHSIYHTGGCEKWYFMHKVNVCTVCCDDIKPLQMGAVMKVLLLIFFFFSDQSKRNELYQCTFIDVECTANPTP